MSALAVRVLGELTVDGFDTRARTTTSSGEWRGLVVSATRAPASSPVFTKCIASSNHETVS